MAPQSMHTPKAVMNNQLVSGPGRLAPELFIVPRVVRAKRCRQRLVDSADTNNRVSATSRRTLLSGAAGVAGGAWLVNSAVADAAVCKVPMVAEPGIESPEAPVGADIVRGEPGGSKPPVSEDVLGPSSAFAGEPVAVPSPPAAPVSSTSTADAVAFSEFAAPSLNLPTFDNIPPAVLAVGGGALAAGLGAATYLAATKDQVPASSETVNGVQQLQTSLQALNSAVREKGAELETILLEEKKKADDLNSKLTFYGGAYSKLSNKLQASEQTISQLKSDIREQKARYAQLATKSALSDRDMQTFIAGERERGVELENALRAEQDRAADLVGKLTFYGNAYQKLQGKLTASEKQIAALKTTIQEQRGKYTALRNVSDNAARDAEAVLAAERAKTEELEGVISEKELRTVDLSNKVAFYGQAYQKLQGKLSVAEKSISSLQKAINEGKAKLRVAGNENVALAETAKKLEEALTAEQGKAADLNGKLTFYGGAYQKLQSKLTAAESQISGMKKTLTEQKSKYSTLANQLALAQRDAELTTAAADEKVKEVEAALATEQQKKQEFAQRIEFYGNAYQKLQGKLAGAEAQVSHLKATVQEQKSKYTQLLNEKALGERDAAALVAAAENRAAELEAQLKSEQSKKDEYSNKLTFYGSAYQKLQGKLTGAEGEIKNLKTAIAEQRQKTSHIANTLAMAEKEFAANLAAEKAKSEVLETSLNVQEQKVADMGNKISFYGQAYKKLQDKLAAAEKQVNGLKAAIAEEKRTNGQLRVLNSMANEKTAQLEKALENEQNRVSDLTGKITFYGDAYKKLQGKLTGAEKQISTLKTSVAEQKAKTQLVASQAAIAEREAASTLAAEKSKVAAMEKALEGEQGRVADLGNKLAFYGDAYKRLQGKLASAEAAVNNIKKELANQKKKYTELSTKLAYTEKELQAERERGLELEGVLAAEQSRAAELSTRIAFFGQAYTKVSNKLEGAEKKNKELVATLTAVQRKSDSLEKQLAGAQAQLIEAQMGGTKEASSLVVELDSKLGEAGAMKSHLEQASSVITQLQSQLKVEREKMGLIEKARDEAIKDQKEVSFALKDEIEKNAALSNQLLKLQKGFDAAQQAVAETTQQLQAARNEAHHLQSALAHTQEERQALLRKAEAESATVQKLASDMREWLERETQLQQKALSQSVLGTNGKNGSSPWGTLEEELSAVAANKRSQ
eukprot:jgi/Botrbrau1/3704/Bobra.0008s0029.1